MQTVINLISDKDKDVRAIGLDQVRDEAKSAEATRRFAALLLASPDAQVGLLGALAGRGDAAAKPAVLDLFKVSHDEVRFAAIRARFAGRQAATCRGWSLFWRRQSTKRMQSMRLRNLRATV